MTGDGIAESEKEFLAKPQPPVRGWTSRTVGGLRYHLPMPLRWRDLDGYNHVNNATLLTLIEEARIRAFWMTPDDEGVAPTPLAVVDAGSAASVHTVVGRHEVEYFVPIRYSNSPLDIVLWICGMGGASARVAYEVWSPLDAQPRVRHAAAISTIVFVDAASGRPRRLDEAEREAWTPYLGDPPALRGRG